MAQMCSDHVDVVSNPGATRFLGKKRCPKLQNVRHSTSYLYLLMYLNEPRYNERAVKGSCIWPALRLNERKKVVNPHSAVFS